MGGDIFLFKFASKREKKMVFMGVNGTLIEPYQYYLDQLVLGT